MNPLKPLRTLKPFTYTYLFKIEKLQDILNGFYVARQAKRFYEQK